MRPSISWLSFATAAMILVPMAVGCGFPPAGSVPPPITASNAEAAKTRFPDSNEASLNAGRELFAAHCDCCHHYPDVSQIGDARWPSILASMGKKAGLDDAQTRAVLSFVIVARSQSAKAQ
jgi:hypothetical protein